MKKPAILKSASCQIYRHPITSSSSESSTSSSASSSENSDTPLKRFNRILRSSVARHWPYFRRDGINLRSRGRSISDAGLCTIVGNDPDLAYLDVAQVSPRRSLRACNVRSKSLVIPRVYFTSAGGGGGTGAQGGEEASDSEPERPRRGHHLRVPTPAFPGQQSTGNFAASGAGGGGGGPRSAPATPLQLHPADTHRTKHDKHAVKPLSGSAPSVRATAIAGSDAEGSKAPSKARQKKFQRHFPQVGPEERVLNYYSCALVGDLLLQGHLYITKNYFAFYSNVFGYVTKLLIPTASVLRITKEKVARIIPNAVGVCTRDERHVFGSLLSRDATYKLMNHVWKASRAPELAAPKPSQELRASEVELDASEYSPEDDSSSGGGEPPAPPPAVREPETIIAAVGAAVIQPALLTGGGAAAAAGGGGWRRLLLLITLLLAASAAVLGVKVYASSYTQEEALRLSGEEMYVQLVRWRSRLHGRAASELHSFLAANLLLLTQVRQSLEALSGVLLADMAAAAPLDFTADAS